MPHSAIHRLGYETGRAAGLLESAQKSKDPEQARKALEQANAVLRMEKSLRKSHPDIPGAILAEAEKKAASVQMRARALLQS